MTAPAELKTFLPNGCTGEPGERVLSLVNAHGLRSVNELPALLRTLYDPWTCEPEQLALLAWAWSVDIWVDAWPIERKRFVVAEARGFHRLKTTVRGYRMALGYVDAELVRAHLPRNGFVISRPPSPEAFERYLALLPEIRIYPNTPRTKASAPGFVVGRRGIGSAALAVLSRRRAVLIRGGVTTPLVFAGVAVTPSGALLADAERLVIPGPLRRGLKIGGALKRPARSGKSAAERVISLSFVPSSDSYLPNQLSPSLTPAEVTPRRLWEPYTGRPGMAVGLGGLGRRALKRDTSEEREYLSIRLADGTAPIGSGNRRGSPLGRGRLQRIAYTAGLLVHVPMPARKGFPLGGRVLRGSPEKRLAEVANAVAVAKPARDRLFLDFNSVRPVNFADLDRNPDLRFGDSVRV